jgi:hypothetical protein
MKSGRFFPPFRSGGSLTIGLVIVLLLDACGGAAAPAPTPTVAPVPTFTATPASAVPPTPTPEPPTPAPTGLDRTDLAAFRTALLDLLSQPNRDYAAVERLLGGEFMVAGWQAGGANRTPAEAMELLRTDLLPPTAALSYELEANLAQLLNADPTQLFPQVVETILSHGWRNGQSDGLLLISRNADGTHVWAGVVIADQGFAATPAPAAQAPAPPPDSDAASAFSSRLLEAINNRDATQMTALMGNSFTIALWQSGGNELPPAEATAQLVNNHLVPGNIVMDVGDGRISTLLAGTDPLTMWGPAVQTVKAVHTVGWGQNGGGDAVLILALDANQAIYWHSILLIQPQ